MRQAIQRRIELAESLIMKESNSVDKNKTIVMIAELIRKGDTLKKDNTEYPEDNRFCELISQLKY